MSHLVDHTWSELHHFFIKAPMLLHIAVSVVRASINEHERPFLSPVAVWKAIFKTEASKHPCPGLLTALTEGEGEAVLNKIFRHRLS